ncbi:hypothetical protein L1D55_25395 [Vibrio sp. Isolate22]|uniref:hypothetical protein n=1 Tax=Vibrio TaxID=662 RepID=UPI001EFC6A85|nr:MULTISPECIES: hypothetical protein [Vibrio]MCG9695000.1 hypothetical protein [Vibrio sp. Isolate22]CAK6715042.1 hypothetical protein HORM4_550002 [Vibrio harveyi]
MSLVVKTPNWGEAQKENLYQVLLSAKSALDKDFASDADNDIWVFQNLARGNPITLYARGENGEYQIELSTTNRLWSKYAYQFAHEYCHVRTNYNVGSELCKWFEESICELASIYALRRMSEVWEKTPPYENWREYSVSLLEYSDEVINRQTHQLDKSTTFADWFPSELPSLEQDQYLRDSNAIIAIELLPLFEEYPILWNSMTYWNSWEIVSTDSIDSSFSKWIDTLPDENKESANLLIERFGFSAK